MASPSTTPTFPPFHPTEDGGAVGKRWKKWLSRLENYLVAIDIQDEARKKAMLLHFMGEETHTIYENLASATPPAQNAAAENEDENEDQAVAEPTYDDVKNTLSEHFEPQKNLVYDTYTFRSTKQESHETVDQYCTRLRGLAKTCEFHNADREILMQVILTCNNSKLRRNKDIELDGLLKLARSLEIADKQALVIENTSKSHADVNVARRSHPGRPKYSGQTKTAHQSRAPGARPKQDRPQTKTTCRNCGGIFPHGPQGCPARNQKCLFCSKLNHFAKVCRAKRERRVHRIKEEDVSNSDDEYTFTVGNNPGRNKLPYREVKVGANKVNFLIDTGASINVIGEETHRKVGRPKLTPCRTVIRPYGGGKLPVKGKFQTVLESGSKITVADIYVIEGKKANSNLLSYPTAVDLMLVEFKHSVNAIKADKAQQLEHEYRDVFNNGIGKLKNTQIKLHVDETVSPVRQPHRRIPFHMRKQVENELKELEKQDIIERVDGPTPWVSPIVVVPKPKTNSIRICIDMREANKAIQRERHVTPTIDDLIHDLNGATHFSHLDLRSGYHQLEPHPDSRNVTTFATHVGLRRYKRLIFGINAASEIFQNTIEQVLAGIKGVRNISDDIIVYGKGQEAHDRALHDTLKRLRETGLTLNHEKCEFNKTSLEFYGHVFGKSGISAAPSKVKAIVDCPAPTTPGEIPENCDKSIEVIAKVQGELTVNQDQDLLLRGNRIIIPATLQSRVIAIAHEGHQGISKTKALLREKVWFPGIDDKVNEALKGCLACQATTKTPTAVPLQPTVMPEHPWSELCADFWGPLPSGDYLLVVIDEHSRYPVVEHLRSTSAQAVIPVLDKIFAMFGTPEVLKTDNGPPWTSTQMKSFADYLGFHHRKVTPYWPCANGTAERFMRVLGKTVKAAVVEGKSWKQELHKMLRSYRATPHTTTNHPPATLLFQRAMKTRLPELTLKQPEVNKEAKQNDQKAKMEMKKYTDRKRKAKENNIDIGDTVLVSQRKQNKLTPPYDPKPHRVIGKKNTMITAENNGRRITRNATFFKKVKIEEEDSEDDGLEENNTEENKTEDHANRNHPQTTGNTNSYVTRFGRAWTQGLGNCIASVSLVVIPLVAVINIGIALVRGEPRSILSPLDWGPYLNKHRRDNTVVTQPFYQPMQQGQPWPQVPIVEDTRM
ncbi:hypothetical protein Bbelb_084940 [Branchiostoma belcheri]|nr:hypothetical protein Bbelb_084940 [Branchiostoma belcheri]